MRLNINLASRPYQDSTRFYLTWLPLLAVLLGAAIASCTMAYRHRAESHNVRDQIADKRQQITQIDKELADARTTLDLPQNSGTRDQAQFLNGLFQRKAFSWTRILSDLETVMPDGVQVISIKPEVTKDGQLQFTMVVAADRREDAIELARRMERSPHFVQPAITTERAKKDQKDNRLEVEIVSQYLMPGERGSS